MKEKGKLNSIERQLFAFLKVHRDQRVEYLTFNTSPEIDIEASLNRFLDLMNHYYPRKYKPQCGGVIVEGKTENHAHLYFVKPWMWAADVDRLWRIAKGNTVDNPGVKIRTVKGNKANNHEMRQLVKYIAIRQPERHGDVDIRLFHTTRWLKPLKVKNNRGEQKKVTDYVQVERINPDTATAGSGN